MKARTAFIQARCALGARITLIAVLVLMAGMSTSAFAEPCCSLDAAPCSDDGTPRITDPPHRAIWHAKDGGAPNLLVPALEVPVLNTIIWGYDRLTGKDYAKINLYTMGRNLNGAWVWDDDNYKSNAFGHPYHGSLFFTAARSSGLGFWESMPYVLVGSAMWETLYENLPPSKNDLITTTIGGIFLGEILHRTSLLILDDGHPTILRSIGSFLVEPAGALNRYFFGRKANDFYPHASQFIRFGAGVNATLQNYVKVSGVKEEQANGAQVHLTLDLDSGIPGDPKWKPRKPFDYFSLQGRLELARTQYVLFFMDGLLVGTDFSVGRLRGIWGLFGGYQYTNVNTLRVSTVSLGPGASAQLAFSDTLVLRPTIIVSGVPFGQGGSLQPPIVDRDYHYGPGAQAQIDLQLVRSNLGRIGVNGRIYAISGSFLGEGWEVIRYLSAYAEVSFIAKTGMGIELFLANRNSQNESPVPSTYQQSSQLRIYWTLFSDGGVNALVRTGP